VVDFKEMVKMSQWYYRTFSCFIENIEMRKKEAAPLKEEVISVRQRKMHSLLEHYKYKCSAQQLIIRSTRWQILMMPLQIITYPSPMHRPRFIDQTTAT